MRLGYRTCFHTLDDEKKMLLGSCHIAIFESTIRPARNVIPTPVRRRVYRLCCCFYIFRVLLDSVFMFKRLNDCCPAILSKRVRNSVTLLPSLSDEYFWWRYVPSYSHCYSSNNTTTSTRWFLEWNNPRRFICYNIKKPKQVKAHSSS